MAGHIDELITSLSREAEKIRVEAENRMASIHQAIEVLQGVRDNAQFKLPEVPPFRPPAPPVMPEGAKTPSVSSMLFQAAEALGNVLLDNGPWKKKAGEMFPGNEDKINRGMTNARETLIGQGKVVSVQGGWKLPQFVKPGEHSDPVPV